MRLYSLLLILTASAAFPDPVFARGARLSASELRFITSCTEAFDRSSGNGATGIGKQICECTAHESRHESVSSAALKRETAEIEKDPKHKIQDQRLLNAFHYCSIEKLKALQ